MKLLLYCTKANPTLYNVLGKFITTKYMGKDFKQNGLTHPELNGKIVVECDYEVEEIKYKHIKERDKIGILHNESWYEYKGLNVSHYECDLDSRSGFDDSHSLFDYLFEYLRNKEGYPQDGYAINIKNLHIFDKPRELNKFTKDNTDAIDYAPSKMIHIWYYNEILEKWERSIYVPVSSQELCRILNKEQTALIRRNVLKDMLNNGKR